MIDFIPDDLKEKCCNKHFLKHFLIILISLFLVVIICNIVFRSSDVSDSNEIIRKAEASGNAATARNEYKKLIEKDFFKLEYHRGYIRNCIEIYDHNTQREGETRVEGEYVKYSSNNDANISDVGYYGLGYIYALGKNYHHSLEYFIKVKNIKLKFLNNSIGHIYFMLGDIEKAKEFLFKEIEYGGNLEGAYANLSLILYKQRDFDKLTELIADKQIKKYIPVQIVRIVYLQNGDFFNYICETLDFRYVKSYGFTAASLILFVWFWYIRKLDVFEPESISFLLITLATGMFFAEFCIMLYDLLAYSGVLHQKENILKNLIYCIFGIGFIEETVKIIPFLLVLRFSRQINESIDYVIYASVSALGFAFMENLIYFQETGLSSITGRGMASVPVHIGLTTLAVYGLIYSKYKKNGKGKLFYFLCGFAAAVVLHGLFDFFLMTEIMSVNLAIVSILILATIVNKFSVITKNALNVSEFNEEQKTRIESRTKFLAYSILAIITAQYVLMAWKFDAGNANSAMLKQIIFFYFLIMIIAANLGKIEITKERWTSILEEKKPPAIDPEIKLLAKKRAAAQNIDFEELQNEYCNWEKIALRSTVLFAFLIITGLVFSLSLTASLRHLIYNQNCKYLLLPNIIFRLGPALFVGLLVSEIPVKIIFKGISKN